MSPLPKHLIRYCLALLGSVVIAGCSSGDGTGTEGTITLDVTPPSATVQQGAQTQLTGTLTRGGGFTGTVNFTVTGAPTGVTATLENIQTSGNVTTATITVMVSASAAVGGPHTITVRGTAPGLTDATDTFQLTITAAGSFTLAITPAGAVTLQQGGTDNSRTINITRTNYAAAITLSAEGLPTGVTATFAGNPVSGNSSVMTLTATAGATLGGPVTVTVRGTGPASLRNPGEAANVEATVTFQLTITVLVIGNFTLTTTPATNLSLTQGTSGDVTVNIVRTGGFTGSVNLTVTGLVTGLTHSFNPASATGASSTLTLTAAGTLAVGTYPIIIRGNFAGLAEQTVNLDVIVTAPAPVGNYTLSTTPPANVGVTQGASANVTVNINRTGGNTSNVALTATGTLPTGMTLVFLPTSTTTNSSVLTVTTTGATPVGTTPIVIRGNTAGLAEQTVNLNIIVTAPGGSGNVTVTFATCAPANKAVWLAFMDGTSGTWTAVTGVGDVYQFNITQSKGSFAYVTLGTGTSAIIVQHMTQAELTAAILDFCGSVASNTRVANGTYSNLPANFLGLISFGGGAASVFGTASGTFQITNAMNGTFDLIGYASALGGIGAGDRVFVKRGENPAPGGNFSVPVNFLDATLSAQAAAASATLQGLVGDETLVNHGMNFFTGGTACVPAVLYGTGTTAASFNIYGVPASLRLGTDMHSISITASHGATSFRFLLENFLDIAARAATPFVLPAQLPVPVATDAGGPYKRPSIAVTGVPAELNISHSMTYTDQTVSGKTGVVTATQGWVGGSNLTLVLPNFAGVGTFMNSWAPATGDALDWTITSSGGVFTGACTAGQRFVSSTRTGTL